MDNEPRHILVVDHVSDLGGAEFSLETLVTHMTPEKYRYTVALPRAGPLIGRLAHRGIVVDVVQMESWRWWVNSPIRTLKFWLALPLSLISLVRWIRYLRHMKPDLIHFNVNRLVEPIIAARLTGIPSIIHFRDIPSRIKYRFAFGQRGLYVLMNLATRWIANSQATKEDIIPHARCPVTTIFNGFDLQDFDEMAGPWEAMRGQASVQAETFKIAMVAGLTPWKNHQAFLRLAKIVCSKRDDVVFLIAGSGNPTYESELKALGADLALQDNVRFLGFIDNVPRFLTGVDLLVHTTNYEPFGRVFVEAMAARKAVIAMKGGGAMEVVKDGETGILIAQGELDEMADAVGRLLDDPALRHRMGLAGRKRVEALFGIEQHCQAVASIYKELLAKQHA